MQMIKVRTLVVIIVMWVVLHPSVLPASPDEDLFKRIYESEWSFRLKEFPLMATAAGVHEYDSELAHVSEQDQLRRYTFWEGIHQQLEVISCVRLSREECINYRLFGKQIDDFMADYQAKAYLIPFTSDGGFYTWNGTACRPKPISAARRIIAITCRACTRWARSWMNILR